MAKFVSWEHIDALRADKSQVVGEHFTLKGRLAPEVMPGGPIPIETLDLTVQLHDAMKSAYNQFDISSGLTSSEPHPKSDAFRFAFYGRIRNNNDLIAKIDAYIRHPVDDTTDPKTLLQAHMRLDISLALGDYRGPTIRAIAGIWDLITAIKEETKHQSMPEDARVAPVHIMHMNDGRVVGQGYGVLPIVLAEKPRYFPKTF